MALLSAELCALPVAHNAARSVENALICVNGITTQCVAMIACAMSRRCTSSQLVKTDANGDETAWRSRAPCADAHVVLADRNDLRHAPTRFLVKQFAQWRESFFASVAAARGGGELGV